MSVHNSRRAFCAKGALGAIGLGMSGCSAHKYTVKWDSELPPVDMKKESTKPSGGTMPMGELGQTGIKVSKMAFGSHMRPQFKEFTKEREWMVREANSYGVNLFDVYDIEHKVYQYEPMGRYLAPIINDVLISIAIWPYDGRTMDQELERDLRLFGRDYIDMVRIHIYSPDDEKWGRWDKLFKYKEQGKIRAIGMPVHRVDELYPVIDTYPIDYVVVPYNFYHNYSFFSNYKRNSKFRNVVQELRDKGIGIVTMKPFLGDWMATPVRKLMESIDETGEINYGKACLRYVMNSGMDIDTTLCGLMNPYHVHENVDAFFNPAMSDEERRILKHVRDKTKTVAHQMIPDHYRFLEDWAPDAWDDRDLFGTV